MQIWIDGIIYTRTPLGGVRRYFDELLTRLPAMEPNAELFVTEALPGSVRTGKGIRVVPVFASGGEALRHPARALRSFRARIRLHRSGPNVFHASYYTRSPFAQSLNVVTAYDFVDARFPELHPNGAAFVDQQRTAIEAADRVLAISESTARDVLTFTAVPPERVRTIRLAVGEVFRKASFSVEERGALRDRVCNGHPYWLFVGRRASYKNFIRLLEAFVALAPSVTAHLVICGPDEPWATEHQQLVDGQGLSARVHLFGPVNDQRLRDLYAAAELMVFPSMAEGFGLPLLEAMACGTPVVASDIPVFREVAGPAAEYFDPRSTNDLTAALCRALEPGRRAALVQHGAERVAAWPTWADVVRGTLAVYQELLA